MFLSAFAEDHGLAHGCMPKNGYASARCRPKTEADNRVAALSLSNGRRRVTLGDHGRVCLWHGLPVGLHLSVKSGPLGRVLRDCVAIEEPCSKLQGIFEMEGVFTNLKFAR
jgi:hypothetical protein